MIVDGNNQNMPLCPNVLHPIHPSHAMHVYIQDDIYNTTPKNEDNEFVDPAAETMYHKLAYGQGTRMYLYRDEAIVVYGNRVITVESWYFRCKMCSLILPATEVKQ